jgi:hypothetical protein
MFLALAMSCSSSLQSSTDAGRDSNNAESDAPHDVADAHDDILRDALTDSPCTGGQILVYGSPGCGVSGPTPVCAGPAFDACLMFACGCNGQQIGGCGVYTEPFAHLGACDDGGSPF